MYEIDRRTAIKWVLGASAALRLPSASFDALAAAPAAQGYGKDPNLLKVYAAGELWPLTLTKEQRATATALCDLIIPADDTSPAASSVGVVDFIDEWISAPYPEHAVDRKTVLDGLSQIEGEAQRRFKTAFAKLSTTQLSTTPRGTWPGRDPKSQVSDTRVKRSGLSRAKRAEFGTFRPQAPSACARTAA